jgi:hypothetical protein
MKPQAVQSLQDILVRILDEKIPAEGARKKKISKREAIIRRLLKKAEEGDIVAQDVIMKFIRDNPTKLRSFNHG